MSENSFLKKFQGRTEQIGRGGLSEIMNNLHINVIDYIPKKKKVKIPKIKVDPFGHISSEISVEFNKNINYQPQTKNLSLSQKKISKEEEKKMINNKINKKLFFDKLKDNNDKDNKSTNISNNKFKLKNKNNLKNKEISNIYKNKTKEEPIKILKNLKYNININNKNNNKNKENNDIYQKMNKKNLNIENNNKLLKSKKRSNSIPLNIKFPLISQSPSSKKNIGKNILTNHSKSKGQERVNTYTPQSKNYFVNNTNSQIINSNIKSSLNKRINSKNDNFKNDNVNKQYNFPKIDKKYNKMTYIEKDNNIELYNKQKNLILNNIKNDFMMLNSIKNRANNNISKSQTFEEKNLYQYKNLQNNINTNNTPKNKKNSIYLMNTNNSTDIKKQNVININFSQDNNDFNNLKSRNIKSSENSQFKVKENNKPHTSFDTPLNIPKLKNKLDIIHEESEDDNKYLTDVKLNNSFENQENMNSLEILMKQRARFQTKIPNNSRFKLK